MDVTYSLLVAVIVSFLPIFTKFDIIRWVYTCVTWLKDMMYLRSLPSPPRRCLLGRALEVRMYAIKILHTYGYIAAVSCKDKNSSNAVT